MLKNGNDHPPRARVTFWESWKNLGDDIDDIGIQKDQLVKPIGIPMD